VTRDALRNESAKNDINGNNPTLGDATSQFAAGFAAATALSNSHIRSAVNEVLANRAKAAAANRQHVDTYGDGSMGCVNDVVQNKDESIDTRTKRFVHPQKNIFQ